MLTPPSPPGPLGLPLSALQGDLTGALMQVAHDYGDIASLNILGKRIFLLNHPDLLKEALIVKRQHFVKGRGLKQAGRILMGNGLLTSEGDFHRQQRQRLQPLFHRQAVQRFGDDIVACGVHLCERWEASARSDRPLDVFQEMMGLTLAVVGKTIFNSDVEAENHVKKIASAVVTLSEWLAYAIVLPFAEQIENLPVGPGPRVREAQAALDNVVYQLIAERQTEGHQADFLSLLLQAQDENGQDGLSDKQVRDEAMVLFLAGNDTISVALTWTWYLLSQHPEVEARLHAELDAVLGDRPPTVEDLEQLTYTRMILAESMRLYPPVWMINRQAVSECEIGGYHVSAGDHIVMSQWVLHHDPRYYPDPFRFDPERWTPEAQAERPKYAYFPFGGGNRVCIGEHFAWMEGVLLLATIAQKWKLRLVPNHPVAFRQRINLRPKYGMRMTLEPRQLVEPKIQTRPDLEGSHPVNFERAKFHLCPIVPASDL